MDASIRFSDVSVDLGGGTLALDRVDLSIAAGEAVAFVGRSGAGKTTALRLINGLVRPARGEVIVSGSVHHEHELPQLRRRIGYIIQGSGLLPHRTVFDNIAVVPKLLGWSAGKITEAVESIMEELQLPAATYAGRYPRTLSGGEQQRAGIARAIIFSPAILLCDEPFGALDPVVRRELQELFASIRRSRELTLVFVTHDLPEALTVAGRVVHFDRGRIIADAPAEHYPSHADPLVQQFVAASRLPSGASL